MNFSPKLANVPPGQNVGKRTPPKSGGLVYPYSIYYVSLFLSECANASTAAPSFIAGGLLRLLFRRRMEYAAWDFAFGKVLCISLLLVLCKFFAFLVSFLLVLCKFSASFFRSFLRSLCRSSARAAESAGKVRPKMAPTPIQNGANLAQAVGKGYPKINRNIKKLKNANANTTIIKNTSSFFMCGDFHKKRRAQRLGMYRCFVKTK